jgi:hypothetical protein
MASDAWPWQAMLPEMRGEVRDRLDMSARLMLAYTSHSEWAVFTARERVLVNKVKDETAQWIAERLAADQTVTTLDNNWRDCYYGKSEEIIEHVLKEGHVALLDWLLDLPHWQRCWTVFLDGDLGWELMQKYLCVDACWGMARIERVAARILSREDREEFWRDVGIAGASSCEPPNVALVRFARTHGMTVGKYPRDMGDRVGGSGGIDVFDEILDILKESEDLDDCTDFCDKALETAIVFDHVALVQHITAGSAFAAEELASLGDQAVHAQAPRVLEWLFTTHALEPTNELLLRLLCVPKPWQLRRIAKSNDVILPLIERFVLPWTGYAANPALLWADITAHWGYILLLTVPRLEWLRAHGALGQLYGPFQWKSDNDVATSDIDLWDHDVNVVAVIRHLNARKLLGNQFLSNLLGGAALVPSRWRQCIRSTLLLLYQGNDTAIATVKRALPQ